MCLCNENILIYKTMLFNKIINVFIKAKQFLKDIMPFKKTGIPSNTILFKTLTGCGATSLEIEWPRNSIIIEPNVPVIVGKSKKHKKVLGVYENVTADQIAEYIESDIPFKKIIVTPESFYRVKDAIGERIYTDYFLLMDECERTIQDVGYRSNIILPMFDFFKFKQKAFVSATPIMPSDPMFIRQKFKIMRLKPKFQHKEAIKLIHMNNIILTLQKFIENNPRDKYFIFFNSTENIAEVITKLNIKPESAIYCSRDSRKKLRLNEYIHVYTELKNFKKFNFLTCRFFSAVDIDYETHESDPMVIMVSDLVFAQHTMIDPKSEAIQIVGRFRKSDVVDFKKEIVHITNTNPNLESMCTSEVLEYIKECHLVYKVINRFYLSVTTIGAKDILRQMLERIDYSRFINKHDGSRNHYMVDNMIHEEKIKGYYQSISNLKRAYKASNAFIVHKVETEQYAYTDKDRLENRKSAPLKSLTKIVAEALKELHSGTYTDFQIQQELANLQWDFPNIMVHINRIGQEEASKLGYDLYAIKAKLNEKDKARDSFGLMTFIKENFSSGDKQSSTFIEDTLERGIKSLNLTGLAPGVRLLRKFCELSENRVYIGKNAKGEDIRGYKIIRFWDNIS